MSLRIFGLLLLLTLGSNLGGWNAGMLRADVIYTNFGTDDTYATGAGMVVTNDSMAWSSVAIQFIPVNNYNLTGIEFVASDVMAADPESLPNSLSLGIFADNNGAPGGAPLESFSVSGPLGVFGTIVPVITVTSVLQPVLLADTAYWIGMQGPAGGLVVWNQNVTGAVGFSSSDGFGNWSASTLDQGVVEIDGTIATDVPPPPPPPPIDPPPAMITTEESTPTVPEPSAVALTFIGFAAMRALRQLETKNR